MPNVAYETVRAHRFHWARRFGHAAREIAFTYACLRKAQALSKLQRFALVVSHTHALAAVVGPRLRRRFGTATALVAHADIHDRPSGTYDPLLTQWLRHVTPIAYRESDRTLAVSAHIATAAVTHGATPARVRVVPNGVDAAEVGGSVEEEIARGRDASDVFRILFVGRLAPEKGVADLLTAVSQLKQRGVRFALQLIGDGPLRHALKAQASLLGLDGHTEFLGSVPRSQLGRYYSRAHITCVPSISEPQGIVVLESLCCGTPVVGSAVGGLLDMVVDGSNGLLVSPSSPSLLANAIRQLAEDRSTLRVLQFGAARSVAECWSWEAIGNRLATVVGELIADERPWA
jgi:glycosyltransferase involved in cell wall biosynthesis